MCMLQGVVVLIQKTGGNEQCVYTTYIRVYKIKTNTLCLYVLCYMLNMFVLMSTSFLKS